MQTTHAPIDMEDLLSKDDKLKNGAHFKGVYNSFC